MRLLAAQHRRDPPFSRLDLVSCRNVLIYMDAAMQRRVLPILHYALNPGGFLFLGGSENIGPFADLFAAVDAKHRIFSKKQTAAGLPVDFGHRVHRRRDGAGRPAPARERATLWSGGDVQREADRLVLARYAPVGVVIDETMTVLQFRGRTAGYLEPAPGMASLDLLRMLREGLLADVRSAVNQARAENVVVVQGRDLAWPTATPSGRSAWRSSPSRCRLRASASSWCCSRKPARRTCARPQAPPAQQPAPVRPARRAQLQQELAALREYLQSVIEEQESTNEELKSANEEILSTNEELQSTNEELQTAKEEAQSANEELATVNEELRHRNAELARVNNDLVNLLSGVNIPIVMVSRDLRIRRFTPAGREDLQPDPHRPGPADQRHQAQPPGRRSGAADHRGDRQPHAQRERGAGPGGAVVFPAHPSRISPWTTRSTARRSCCWTSTRSRGRWSGRRPAPEGGARWSIVTSS